MKTYTANRETVILEVKNITAFPGKRIYREGLGGVDNLKQESVSEKRKERKRELSEHKLARWWTQERMY